MLPIPEIVSSLGLGGQIATAMTLLLVAVYIYKAQAIAGYISAAVGTAVGFSLVVVVALAIFTGAGWIDPRPSTMIEHGRRAWLWGSSSGLDLLRHLLDLAL